MKIVDTHQHLIYPDNFEYPWLSTVPALAKPFTLEAYEKEAEPYEVTKTIFMEVDVAENQSADEAKFFYDLADKKDNSLSGIIAAARPEKEGFEAYLESIQSEHLKGIRRVLHTQPDELSQSKLFCENISLLEKHNLTFDICVLQKQINLAYDLAKACPHTTFILDHCGVPDINEENFVNWMKQIKQLSELPNVNCKISGIIAYTAPEKTTLETFLPYMNYSLEQFGPDRIVFGSDWPVSTLTSDYKGWADIATKWASKLSQEEQEKFFHKNAETIYRV